MVYIVQNNPNCTVKLWGTRPLMGLECVICWAISIQLFDVVWPLDSPYDFCVKSILILAG